MGLESDAISLTAFVEKINRFLDTTTQCYTNMLIFYKPFNRPATKNPAALI